MHLHNCARCAGVLAAFLTPLFAVAQTSALRTTSTAPFVELGGLHGALAERLSVDPSNAQTVYADVSGGRIARTFSGGQHWEVVQVASTGAIFRAIAVDPVDPSIVMAFSALDDGAGAALYMSQDRGGHWARLAVQPVGEQGTPGGGRGIVIDSSARLIVLADRQQGILRSADFGATWTNPLPGSLARTYGLYADPNDRTTLWTAGSDGSGLAAAWVSHDRAQTWTRVALPVDPSLHFPIALELATQPHSGRVVVGISAVLPDFSGLTGGILVSDDQGASWTQASIATANGEDFSAGNSIVFDSAASNVVYAAGNGNEGMFRSFDGGLTWSQVLTRDGAGFFTLAVAPASAGHAQRLYSGGGGSVQVSGDGGSTWSRSDSGIDALAIVAAADDGQTRGGVIATAFGALFHSDDGGGHWSFMDPIAGTPVTDAFAVDPIARSHPVFALTSVHRVNTLWRSADVGRTWASLPAPLPGPVLYQFNLLPDPSRAGGLLLFTASAAAFNGLLRSTDSGATWTETTIGFDGDFPATSSPLVADEAHPGIVYAAMGSGLWKSSDFGATWAYVPQLPLGLYGIAGLAATSEAVYVVSGGDDGTFSLQKSVDGGNTWSAATGAFDPAPYSIYAAGNRLLAYQGLYAECSDPSVLLSSDGAVTWSLIDGSIAGNFSSCLSLNATPSRLYLSDAFGAFLSYALDWGRSMPPAAGHARAPGGKAATLELGPARFAARMRKNRGALTP